MKSHGYCGHLGCPFLSLFRWSGQQWGGHRADSAVCRMAKLEWLPSGPPFICCPPAVSMVAYWMHAIFRVVVDGLWCMIVRFSNRKGQTLGKKTHRHMYHGSFHLDRKISLNSLRRSRFSLSPSPSSKSSKMLHVSLIISAEGTNPL